MMTPGKRTRSAPFAKRARAAAKPAARSKAFKPTTSVSTFRGLGFPQRLTMKHRYVEQFRLASTTGILAVHNFRCNGMFDPNQTGTGHQPQYFDTLTGIYDHFTVIGSIIKVSVVKPSATELPIIFGVFLNDDTTTTPTVASQLCEQSSAVYSQITLGQDHPTTLTAKWSAKKTFGGSVLGNDALQGSASADPTEQTLYSVFMQTVDGSSTSSLDMLVTIEYIAVWDELKDLAAN